jgi:hypothetical protein
MEFTLYRTSGKEIDYPGITEISKMYGYRYKINIDSFDDLKKLEEAVGDKLIVSIEYESIEIYDDYRE